MPLRGQSNPEQQQEQLSLARATHVLHTIALPSLFQVPIATAQMTVNLLARLVARY